MKPSDMTITFEIEPIVKVVCLATNCRNHILNYQQSMYCNLKHITIDEAGKCQEFDPVIEDKAKP